MMQEELQFNALQYVAVTVLFAFFFGGMIALLAPQTNGEIGSAEIQSDNDLMLATLLSPQL